MIENAHQEAFDILVANRETLDRLVEELLEIWQRPFLLEGNNLAYRVQGKVNITNKIFFKQ